MDVLHRPGELLGGNGLEPLPVRPPPAREIDPLADSPPHHPAKGHLASECSPRRRRQASKEASAASSKGTTLQAAHGTSSIAKVQYPRTGPELNRTARR